MFCIIAEFSSVKGSKAWLAVDDETGVESNHLVMIISSDRSSYSDDVLVYIQLGGTHFLRFWIFKPSYKVTSVTL